MFSRPLWFVKVPTVLVYKKVTVSTYQCSFCFCVYDLNVEVIENCKRTKHCGFSFSTLKMSGNFQKVTPEVLVEWKAPLLLGDACVAVARRRRGLLKVSIKRPSNSITVR